MLQNLSLEEHPVFQDDNAPVHTSRCVQTWLHEHDDEVEHLTCCRQSPELNIIECLCGFLENKVRARFLLYTYYLTSRLFCTRSVPIILSYLYEENEFSICSFK
ncbi:DDE_3 domain-containing protein [Trichonephila clavipes]|uniref:DDE_3 domain-containing protein n=1 Tax=Trichonephila clavipes TaxID=2585209 RepID=A0A8X6SUU3_TRICX|nr:DDE_3 domain-containing protein [Trichonephila clavipes]